MTESEKIEVLENRLAALEKSKRERRWLWVAAAILLPATLYAATAIPNTFTDGDILSAEKLNANFAALANAADPTPSGTIVAFGGVTTPTGWLLCNGATVSRTAYAKLFAAIGSAFGSGDGSTTFHLPDLRGRFLRGVDGAAGIDPDKAIRTAMNAGGATGNNAGSLQGDVFQGHRHNLTPNGETVAMRTTNGGGWNFAGGGFNPIDYSTTGNPLTDGVNGTPRTSGETRPVNAYVNWIIKQ